MSGYRTKGGIVEREHRLSFSFDGRDYSGFAGDTLASALMASGETLFGRSFKYHRPRGVTGGAERPRRNAQGRAPRAQHEGDGRRTL